MIFKPHGHQSPNIKQRRLSQTQGKTSKGELQCKAFLEFYFQKKFTKIRPNFLKNPVTGQNLELDLYNEDLKLAIEFNGAQHFEFNTWMHQNRDRFQNQLYRDLIKQDLCKKNGICLIIVPYTVSEVDIAPFLFEALKKEGFQPSPSSL